MRQLSLPPVEAHLPAPELTGDMLKDLFAFQDYFNSRVSGTRESFQAMPQDELVEWINRFMMATTNELEELRNEVPWKWWKRNMDWDLIKARQEYVDVFHFILSLGLVLGFTPEMLYEKYMEKNRVNHQRQDTGY